MRSRAKIVVPIVLVGWGVLNVVGCGRVASHDDGSADTRAIDAGTEAVGPMDSGVTPMDASDTALESSDGSMETVADAAIACPAPPVETFAGTMTTVTCPIDATAVAGVVTPTCDFPYSFVPNNVFTGPVTLVSHLDRDFAGFDVNPIGDGRIQLMCDYANADGLGIGGIYQYIVASSCTATSAAGFTCVK